MQNFLENRVIDNKFYDSFSLSPIKEVLKPHWQGHIKELSDPRFNEFRHALERVPEAQNLRNLYGDDAVTVLGDLSAEASQELYAALETFKPWKKGPFSLFGEYIDSEWRSELKWQRIIPHISSLENHAICDIGCHNGYYMFRMLAHKPKFVIGLEPVVKHWYNFHLLRKYFPDARLRFELLGIQDIHIYQGVFDTIFCLGILYHHTDPVGMLKKIHLALKPRGQVIIDCQGIPGDGTFALVPEKRYAQASGIWFLPQEKVIEIWLKRSGFREVQCFYRGKLSCEEQRRTPWADVDSLADFLDPKNPDRTTEGYPAPWRFYFRAFK